MAEAGFFPFFVFSLAHAQVPEDIAALAAMSSENYHQQSNIPFYSVLADSYFYRMDAIRKSSDANLAADYTKLNKSRKLLLQLDAASLAVASETPVQDAWDSMQIKWASDPSTTHLLGKFKKETTSH